MSTFEHLHSPR